MAAKKKVVKRKAAASKAAVPAQATTVNMLVNGQVTGQVDAGDQTIGDAATKLARDAGLKAFSIRVNGVAIHVEDGGKPLKGAKTLEVFAKDTRG